MKILRLPLVAILVLLSCKEAKIDADRSGNYATAAATQQPPPVCTIFFPKEKYVTMEGDPFVIAVSADCPPDSPNDAKFEFLQPPPRFVRFSAVYRSTVSALILILVEPQRGDAGTYRVTYSSTHCTGGAGCGFNSFKLKVQRAD